LRPSILVVAPNPFEDARAPAFESDFWLRTRSGHLGSFSNLVRLFNPVGSSQAPLDNRWKAVRSLAGFYLESFLKAHGYDAHAIFAVDEDGAWARGAGRPLAIALSTTFITSVGELARVVARVRAALGPDVPVIVGGQFVWKQHLWGPDRFADRPEHQGQPALAYLFGPSPEPALRDLVYVASEFGEHTLLQVLAALTRGSDLADLPNLVLWRGGAWHVTPAEPEPIDLDADFTRWDLVDEMPTSMVPVRTSVGCPHDCEFCDFVAIHPRLRLRSPASIVDELRLVAARGGKSVSLVDDNALSSPGRTRALARAIAETGLGLRWGGYLRADRMTPDDATLLASAGLTYAWCGIESGDPDMLARMRKRADLAAARRGIDLLTGAGVHVLGTFVVGFPGETRASVDASVAFLNGLRRDGRGRVEYSVFPFHLLPGAPVDRPERRRELGLTGLFDRWSHATMSATEVASTWAPHFFRGVDVSYTYYGGDDSAMWASARRDEAIGRRKALTLAFLDGAPDPVVQERFAALHQTLRFSAGATPSWHEHLAPRERQPRPAGADPRR